MFEVKSFFGAFTIIYIHHTVTDRLFQHYTTESFLSEIIKSASISGFLLHCDIVLRLKVETIGRRRIIHVVEVPVSGQGIDRSRSVACLTALVNPLLVLVGDLPCRIRVDRLAFDIDCGRSRLIPHLYIKLMLSGRNKECRWLSELKLTVKFHVVFSFCLDDNLLGFGQIEIFTELDSNKMAVRLPERRKERPSFGAVVVHSVSKPYLVIAGIPYPCLSRSGKAESRCGKEGRHSLFHLCLM